MLAVIAGLILGCEKEPASNPPPSLVVYPQGEDVAFHQRGEIWEVYYKVEAEYPAEDVLRFIKDSLKRQGWQPLREDYLNPGILSSHETGWDEYFDATTTPETKVHQWLAQWKNQNGDVVWYGLLYRYEKGKEPNLDTVKVFSSYNPANIAEKQLRAAEVERSK